MHKFECNSLENGVTRKHINRAIIHRIEKMTNFTRLCSRRIFSQFAHGLPVVAIYIYQFKQCLTHIHMIHKYQWIMSYILICRSSPIIRHHLIHTSVLESTFFSHQQQYAHNLCKFHSLAHTLVTDWDLLYCAVLYDALLGIRFHLAWVCFAISFARNSIFLPSSMVGCACTSHKLVRLYFFSYFVVNLTHWNHIYLTNLSKVARFISSFVQTQRSKWQ